MNDKHLTEALRADYTAGRMSETEADEYEEHLLSCSKCYDAYYVDLPQERALQSFASEHRALGKHVFTTRRGQMLRVRLTRAVEAGKDEVRSILERFLQGARLATMYPQVATLRGSDSTTVAIDQICRDFVSFSGMPSGASGDTAQFEFTTRARFLVHYVKDKNVLRIQLPAGSQGQITRISILKGDTEEQIGLIGAQEDRRTFDIPLDLLSDDVTLTWLQD